MRALPRLPRVRVPFPPSGRRLPRAVRLVLVIILTAALSAATAITVAYIRTPLPTRPQEGAADEGSTVYFADGRTPIFRLGANREVVRHDQIPDRLRWAVLAAEDRGFYG